MMKNPKQKAALLAFALLAVLTASAEQFTLTYQGYPFKKTLCEDPTYAAGEHLTISAGVPKESGKVFKCWEFDGKTYSPAQKFTMPAKDVVFVPVWDGGTGVEQAQPSDTNCRKILRDGQLVILRDGVEYNVYGIRQNQ
jgi:hypothetical protein